MVLSQKSLIDIDDIESRLRIIAAGIRLSHLTIDPINQKITCVIEVDIIEL